MIHNDHLGTPQKLTDSTGTVKWSADYKPFGDSTITVSTITNNLRGIGQYSDAETSLLYNYLRDLNPVTGRYIEKDPIGMWAGVNLYSYVGNKPLKYIDPFGLSSLTYNSGTGMLTLYDGSGNVVGQYPAGNNTTTGSDPWPTGTYNYSYHTEHPESGPNGPYGSNGNFVFDVPGHTGMGVHSGRNGPQSRTNGCIRTTDPGTKAISNLNANDPLTTITVR